MHIAIFVDFHDSTIGGIQTSVQGQRYGLEKLGHKVTIVSPPPVYPLPYDPGVIIVPGLPFPAGWIPISFPSNRNRRFIEAKLRKRGRIDVIHAQTNIGIGIMAAQIAKRNGIPLVQTMHGRDDVFAEKSFPVPFITVRLQSLFHRHFIPHTHHIPQLDDSLIAHKMWEIMVNHAQNADQVVVPSYHFVDKFSGHGVTKPIEVVSNGIRDDVVDSIPHVLKPITMKGTPLHFMWCGRLSPEKRPIEAIKAVASIKGATLDIYGSGPSEKDLREYIKEHKLASRIRLKGRVEQDAVLKAMQDHDVLIYSSYGYDNQPMVLLEAVAAGIPIVYCDPDLTECMPKGGGLLTDDISEETLKNALTDLQDNPQRLQAMREKLYDNRDKVRQSYHSKKMVTLYKRLTKHNAK